MTTRSIGEQDPLVSVIIPTLGRFEPLLASLRDLFAQAYAPFEIIVVDQNESWPPRLEAERDALRADPRLCWIDRFPIGVVRARNHAVSISRGEIILFVDDDVWIPDPGLIRKHVDRYADEAVDCVCGRELKRYQVDDASREPKVPAVPTTVAPGGRTALEQLLTFDRSAPAPSTVPVFSTCNGSIRRRAFLRIGGFDEGFAGASYGDDADLVLRLWAQGGRVDYDPGPWLVHLLAPGGLRSSPDDARIARQKYASGLIVLFRHASGRDGWPVLYHWVLRRSLLLRKNVLRPWRQPRVAFGLAGAALDAWRVRRQGPRSEFTRRS